MPRILGVIPEHIRRKMPAEARQAIGKSALTMPEIEAKAGAKLERKIQEEIAQYLRLHSIPFLVQRMDRKTSGRVGWPDFTAVIKSRAVFLEVKRPGEMPREEQNIVIGELSAAGAFVRVVRSLPEAIAAIREAGHDA